MAYHTHTYFKARTIIDEQFVTLIRKALTQINHNLTLVTNDYDQSRHRGRHDGACITKKLTGNRKIEFKIKDTQSSYAQTFTDHVTFAKSDLQACKNSYDEGTCTEQQIVITELAGAIIHEAAHACCGDERYASLVDHWQDVEKARQRRSCIDQRLNVPISTPRRFACCGLAGRPC